MSPLPPPPTRESVAEPALAKRAAIFAAILIVGAALRAALRTCPYVSVRPVGPSMRAALSACASVPAKMKSL